MGKKKNSKNLRARGTVYLLQKIRNECEDTNTNLEVVIEILNEINGQLNKLVYESVPTDSDKTASDQLDDAMNKLTQPEKPTSMSVAYDTGYKDGHRLETEKLQARIKELEARVKELTPIGWEDGTPINLDMWLKEHGIKKAGEEFAGDAL